ncbi:MAG: insulinase family protein [Candidatus Aminicenantes bacterium]|nr:MAG: insulinase family protein [Candidatus Aminicenantes bacterium]
MKDLKMKITGFFLLVFLTALFPTAADNTAAETKKHYILDNGLSVYIQKREHIPMVNMVFAINVGSKDEIEKTSGMVHLLEHLILLGPTEFHTTEELNLEMRRHGAYFNAHTSHDLMTFESSLPAQYWEFGLNMLKEKLFHSKFTPQQSDREKGIIFEEISQHHDDPFTLGTSLVLQHLFNDHPYQQPIFGDQQVIEKTTVEEINNFYKKYFVPANCSLAVVGDVNLEQVDNKIQQVLGQLEKKEKPGFDFKPTPPLKKSVKVSQHLDIKEARMVFGFHAPALAHPEQLSLDILKIILGRGINPLLARALFQRGKPLTYSLHTRYVALEYGGAFLIYLTLEPKNVKRVQIELIKFLKTLWKFNYSLNDYPLREQTNVTDYLEAAKSQMKFSHQQFQELGLNLAANYARYTLFYAKHKDEIDGKREPYMKRVEKTTSSDLRDAASRYLSGGKYVLVTILPEKKEDRKKEK